ncbi:hypothetical protein D9M72_600350 [compost metagenome]
MAANVMVPNVGKGAEIREYLEAALGLPPNLVWVDVRFALGEVVTVRCEFQPEPPVAIEEEDDAAPAAPSYGGLNG